MRDAARQKWSLTQEAFDGLLASLGPDREAAAERYLEIRRNLVRLFEWRACAAPEEHADEALNRCARKIAEGEEIRDLSMYSIGVARMLLRELGRGRTGEPRPLDHVREPSVVPPELHDNPENRMECLRQCLGQLSVVNRDLILSYYQGDKGEKIRNRKRLLQLFSVPASTLRMRALRVREALQLCTEDCLQRQRETRL
jgi:DNA-directed RNA polymerase specialized sigma24 family protein